jgi:hypothetical protein
VEIKVKNKMKKGTLFLAATLIAINFAFSQGTAINATGVAADNSAMHVAM